MHRRAAVWSGRDGKAAPMRRWLVTALLFVANAGALCGDEFPAEVPLRPSEVTRPAEAPLAAVCDPANVEGALPGVIDAPARSLSVFAELLFWKVTEGGADNWAQVITPEGWGAAYGSATLVGAPFRWNTGFRVGMGSEHSTGEYDLKAYYTNFSTTAKSQASGEVYSAFLGNFYAGNPDGADFGPHYRSAAVDWDFQFHTIDLEIGHDFPISRALTLRPFAGLKAAVINQSLISNWYHPIDTSSQDYHFNSAVETLKQDFWGIGPAIGVTATIPFSTTPRYSLHLFASPSAALMYGNWRFHEQYRNDGPTSNSVSTPTAVTINTSPIEGAATMARGVIGVEWAQHFSRATTTVRLGYEAQAWMNHVQFYSYNMGRLNNLMSLQGGVLELSVNF